MFGKKEKANKSTTTLKLPNDLQGTQQAYNQTLFQLGDRHFRRKQLYHELDVEIPAQIEELETILEALGQHARELQRKAQQELQKTVDQGKKE